MKHVYLLLFAALCHHISFGQLDSMYYNLDTTQLTTNFFWDELRDSAFPPQPDDLISLSPERVKTTLMQLHRHQLNNNTSIVQNYDQFELANQNLRQQYQSIPLTIVDLRYNCLDTNAMIDGRLIFSEDHLIQLPNTSVFSEKKTTLLYADLEEYEAGTYSFRLDPSHFIHNYDELPSSIRIDFGDGLGLREITIGQTIEVSYTTIEETRNLHAEIIRGDEVHHGLMLLRSNNCISSFASPTYPAPFPNNATSEFPWLISTEYEGVSICGNAYTLVTGAFDKPLIFVEGIDFNRNRSAERNGDFGWCQLTSGIDDPSYDYSMLARMPILLNEAIAHGYDIILLDFCDGANYMEHNGQLLVHLIQTVNANKVGDEPLVVAGASMGGQVVRYALDFMEINNMPHCARLYLSLDSPHEGANIPISIQQAIHLNAAKNAGAQNFVTNYLNRPATKQLLNNRYIPNAPLSSFLHTAENAAWYDRMHTWGMPKQSRNVSIANGSVGGEGLANQYPGHYLGDEPILNYSCEANATWTGPEGRIFISHSGGDPYYNQEGYASNSASNISVHIKSTDKQASFIRWQTLFMLWYGLADPVTEHKVARVAANSVNWDYAPGGFRTTAKDFVDAVNASGDIVSPCNEVTEYLKRHCFIPTASALGIQTNNPFLNIENYLENNPSARIFDREITAGITNQPHTYISEENLAFMMEELFNGENPDGSPLLPLAFSSGVFNYGKEGFNYLRGVHVTTGAHLAVNGEYELHYGLDNSGYPINDSHFKLRTLGHCTSSHVVIDQNGVLELGSANLSSSAQLKLSPESSLTIGTQGQLKIHPGSSVVIENGASMILYTDASYELVDGWIEVLEGGKLIIRSNGSGDQTALLELIGNNSKILLHGGELVIESGNTLSIDHAGQAGGYIEVQDAQHTNILMQPNAKLHLKGNGPSDLILDISNNSDVWTGAGSLGLIQLQDGLVQMHHSGSLWTKNRIQCSNLRIEDPYYQEGMEPATLFITNQNTSTWYNCEFDRVKYEAWRTHSHMHTCTFRNIKSGVDLSEGSFNIQNSFFDGTNLKSNSLSNLSTIAATHFINNYEEHSIQDESLVEIMMSNSSISQGENGILKMGGKLSLKCNSFHDLTKKAIEVNRCQINASSANGAGYNAFGSIGTCMELTLCTGIDLYKGYNDFSGYFDNCIIGSMAGKHYCNDCETWQDASSNYWGSATPFGYDFQTASGLYQPEMEDVAISIFYSNGNSTCNINTPNGMAQGCELILFDPNPTLPTACGSGKPVVRKQKHLIAENNPLLRQQNGAQQGVLREEIIDPSNPEIFTPHFDHNSLDSALVFAASTMELFDSLGNDREAIELFHEILTSGIDPYESDIRWKMHWARYHMKGCVERMLIQQELSAANNVTSFETPIQYYVDILNLMTDTLLTDSTFREQFYLELDKGQLLRTIGQSQLARNAFSHLDDCQLDAPEQIALNNWLQEVDEEISLSIQYLDQGLSPDQIELAIDTSAYNSPMAYSSSNYYFGMWIHDPQSFTFMNCGTEAEFRNLKKPQTDLGSRVYPNPVTDVAYLIPACGGTIRLEFWDPSGALLKSETIQIEQAIPISLHEYLPAVPGIYILHVNSNAGKEVFRIIRL
jgi:pimeloyl-ACP methyl ester carboxylesterase